MKKHQKNNMKVYKDFICSLDKPFGCVLDLYHQLGIMEVFYDIAKQAGIDDPEAVFYPPWAVCCNEKTQKDIIAAWGDSWRNYNYNRRTGCPRTEQLKKYKRPHPLNYADQQRIQWRFYLGDGPAKDNNVPDGVLRIYTDWDTSEIKDRRND